MADNFALAKETVNFLIAEARKAGGQHQALHLIGDLGDINAIGRRDGFDAAMQDAADFIEVVARVPTEWNNEKAYAGVVNALQKHPDISLIFTPSDLHLPSIASALRAAGKWKRRGEPGHVILGGFDGDATAYQMLVDGYLEPRCHRRARCLFRGRGVRPSPTRLTGGPGGLRRHQRPRLRHPRRQSPDPSGAHVGRAHALTGTLAAGDDRSAERLSTG